jgi:hypothetical protein
MRPSTTTESVRPSRLQSFAQDSDVAAQYQRALRLENSPFSSANARREAVSWCEQAAAAGHLGAIQNRRQGSPPSTPRRRRSRRADSTGIRSESSAASSRRTASTSRRQPERSASLNTTSIERTPAPSSSRGYGAGGKTQSKSSIPVPSSPPMPMRQSERFMRGCLLSSLPRRTTYGSTWS